MLFNGVNPKIDWFTYVIEIIIRIPCREIYIPIIPFLRLFNEKETSYELPNTSENVGGNKW